MKTKLSPLMIAVALGLQACGGEEPKDAVLDRAKETEAQVDRAKSRAEVFLPAIETTRDLLAALDLLPRYDCGTPRRKFVGEIVEGARVELACANLEAIAVDDASDAVVMTMHEDGCTIRERNLGGELAFHYSGGEDRLELVLDATKTTVDGVLVGATATYGECGDGASYGFSFTRDGHHIDVRFSERSSFHGEMRVAIDGGEAVTFPVPR